MCLGSKGSPPSPSSASTATSQTGATNAFAAPNPQTLGLYNNFLDQAGGLAQTPFNPATLGQITPWTDQQQAASNNLFNLGSNAGQPVTAEAQSILANAPQFEPFSADAVNKYYSPYQHAVIDATQAQFNNQNAIQANDLLGGAIRAGNAFGGDRAGIAQAQLAGQQQMAQAPVLAGLYQSGYGQALNQYNQMQQQAFQGAGLGMQGLISGTNLGLGGGQAAWQAANYLPTYNQSVANLQQQNAVQQSAYPFQQANWYGSLLGGLGPLTGTTGGTNYTGQGYSTPPTPNPWIQGLGLATTAASAFPSLFGGSSTPTSVGPYQAPVSTRRGGLIPRRAGGGETGGATPFAGAPYSEIVLPGGARVSVSNYMPPLALQPRMMSLPEQVKPPWERARGASETQGGQPAGTSSNPISGLTSLLSVPSAVAGLGTIGSGLGSAVSALLAKRGGPVGRYDDGGPIDATDINLGPSLGLGAPLYDDEEDRVLTASGRPTPAAYQTAIATGRPPVVQPAPDVDPNDAPMGGEDYPAHPAMPGAMTHIPGLGVREPTAVQQWAASPLAQAGLAMLQSRSPYFAEGLGRGFAGAAQAANAQRAQDINLDKSPKMITSGENVQFLTSDGRLITTQIPTETTAQRETRRRLAEREKREAAKPVPSGQGMWGTSYSQYNPDTGKYEPIKPGTGTAGADAPTVPKQEEPAKGAPPPPSDLPKAQEKLWKAVWQVREKEVPPPFTVTHPELAAPRNEEALQGMNAREQALVKGVADYKVDPYRLPMRSRAQILGAAQVYDPSYDPTKFNVRNTAMRAFTASGPEARNFTSMDMTMQHIGSALESADALNNTKYPWWNQISGKVTYAAGDERYQQALKEFKTSADAVGNELARVFRGNVGHSSYEEAMRWRENLNEFDSPVAIKGALKQAAKLLGGRFAASAERYNDSVGPQYERPAESWLSTRGREEFRRALTLDPKQPVPSLGGGAATAPTEGGPKIGERKQFKQGWGVWNGEKYVPDRGP